MSKILEILEDKDGCLSFKRVTGMISLFVAIGLAIAMKDDSMVIAFLGYSASCGGFTIPDNIAKSRRGDRFND